jgi:hypothetical protein
MDRAGHFNRRNKRLRKAARIVPWRDEGELQAVGKALLSVLVLENDIQDQVRDRQDGSPLAPTPLRLEDAFAMISVWKSRLTALEGLPHAVESTAALAQVYWRDSQRRIQRLSTTTTSCRGLSSYGSGFSVMELRLSYSAAIVRCVNGFADSLQQHRAMAASVANLCGQLGIPSWLVDTRHESSHNSLPNLEVLRLSASTLLEFLRSEYWIPRCSEWDNSNYGTQRKATTPNEIETLNLPQSTSTSERNQNSRSAVDFLVEYKACASKWNTDRVSNAINDSKTRADGINSLSVNDQKKRKRKSSLASQKTTILPYDPLFGETGNIASTDDDDSDVTKDDRKEECKLDKPVVNSIWGSSLGTNANRYMLLDITSKKKKKGKHKKKQQKPTLSIPKKRKGEKSPTDFAKLFVQSVLSLQQGYAVATQYLIWGGVGGAPVGHGVLIPGSEVDFPATPYGITKCWQLYSPLVHALSRTWPGFAANMITHLVDHVLLIEESSLVHDNESDQCVRTQELVEGSSRKLFFLSSWIRLLLSQRFMAALDRKFSANSEYSKHDNPLELPLATLDFLDCLGYPLKSLLGRCLDRCGHLNDHSQDSSDSGGDNNFSGSTIPDLRLTKTSRAIARCLQTILGENQISNVVDSDRSPSVQSTTHRNVPSLSSLSEENKDSMVSKVEPKVISNAVSLEEMERMLLLDSNGTNHEELDSTIAFRNKESPSEPLKQKFMGETEDPIRRPAWIKCQHWDACAIGTLPGHPNQFYSSDSYSRIRYD